jgi:YD repeat-containing protein
MALATNYSGSIIRVSGWRLPGKLHLTCATPVYLFLWLTLSTSCRKAGFIMKPGHTVSATVPLADFNEIELHDRVDLVLTYDTIENYTRVEAGENIIPEIETVVTGNRLIIRDHSKFRWTRNLDYRVTVYVNKSNIRKLEYHGAGNITSTNMLKAREFIIDSWTGVGSFRLQLEADYTEVLIRKANADVTLTGSSDYTHIYCADHGSFNLLQFPSSEINMDYRSIRDSHLYVTNLITARMLYKGNVYMKGKPEIRPFYNSTGMLIPIP